MCPYLEKEAALTALGVKCFIRFSLMLVLLSGAFLVFGQKYKIDDSIPPGASGKVLPVRGKVLEIKGLASGVTGKAEALSAALKELGAKTTETEIHIELPSDILFDFDKATLRPQAIPALEKVATVLRSYPGASCSIEGHTDGVGTKQYNQKLSERRASSVKQWLLSHNVSTGMSVRGWGAEKPVAPNALPDGNDNPDGRQKNRRVEIIIKTS
jgi:outer membrane protein OmpA-like peptidoglycan-associated protein